MFDNLRENRHTDPANLDKRPAGDVRTPMNHSGAGFLGMTPGQRLAVAMMLLIAVCVLGTTCLLATGAIRAF
jgi:hypothetical protein